MKLFKNILLICMTITFIVTTSCKKYEDGPLLSLHTKIHRVMGTWDVEYFSINGYDSTTYLKSKSFYGMYNFGEGERFYSIHPFMYSDNNSIFSHGYWGFEHNKDNIHITMDRSINKLGPYKDGDVIWRIIRLTEKELWLKNNYTDGREYFVKFKLFKNF